MMLAIAEELLQQSVQSLDEGSRPARQQGAQGLETAMTQARIARAPPLPSEQQVPVPSLRPLDRELPERQRPQESSVLLELNRSLRSTL